MKRLVLILNGKGGVGKSFFAVNFVQFLKDRDIAHVAIDSDNENSTLKRFHPDALFLDLANHRELDSLFASLEKTNLVVADCRAASTDLFLDYFAEIDLVGVLSSLGASLTLVMPVNHEMDSVDQLQRISDHLGKSCQYVIVRNAAQVLTQPPAGRAPGGTITPSGGEGNPAALEFIAGLHPMKRMATAKEIAQAALFLLSDRSSFMTGSPMIVDGGISVRLA